LTEPAGGGARASRGRGGGGGWAGLPSALMMYGCLVFDGSDDAPIVGRSSCGRTEAR
jgi:hypothetical protein